MGEQVHIRDSDLRVLSVHSRAVLRNPDVTGSSPWLSAFSNDFWGTPLTHSGSHGSYRPLTVLSLRLNALLAGGALQDSPWGFHAGNVLLHVAASLLVLALGRRLLGSPWAAAVAALLFAAHPVHCEAVAGVVGRADLLCAVFSLVSLLAYLRYVDWRELHRCPHPPGVGSSSGVRPPPSSDLINVTLDRLLHPERKAAGARAPVAGGCARCSGHAAALLAASLLAAVLATLSKEPGAAVLGVCFVYEALVQARRARGRGRGAAQPCRLVVLVAAAGALLAARLWVMGLRAPSFAAADNPAAHSPSLLTRTLTFLHLPAVNAALLLWPRHLSFDWSMDAVPRVASLADPRNALSLALYAALWRCARGAWRGVRGSPAGPGAPSNSRGRPTTTTVRTARAARRRVACAACDPDANNNYPKGSSPGACRCRRPRARTLSLTAPEAVLAALALLVLPLLPATNLFFYVGFVVAERVLYVPSIGFCLLVAAGARRVLDATQRPAAVRTMVCVSLLALAARTVLRNRDWHDEVSLYRSAVAVNPPKAYGNLGSVLSGLNKLAEAEHAYRMALQHRPNMAEVHYNLGNLLAASEKYEESAESYRRAITYRPTLALAYVNLGHILAKQGRVQEAARVFRECARIPAAGLKDPAAHESARASALLHLAHLEAAGGRLREAKQALDMALRIKPAHHESGPILKLLAEVDGHLKANQTTARGAVKKFLLEEAEVPAALSTAATSTTDSAATPLNESRCATSDNRRLLSHS
ncbi:Protein O-mannosyl-transferase TMTC2 [Frankliniella fusca]|uniref:dolichyl-phosphate-mannose--protein mannosyltransferase n=1 Tax=Frankliniella fusca TaxID=407009 RepID=A0AAE1HUP5_9NEOP|nr:Protein O-mannosyl-transferase TMTC2 [Frankliniella fusca]